MVFLHVYGMSKIYDHITIYLDLTLTYCIGYIAPGADTGLGQYLEEGCNRHGFLFAAPMKAINSHNNVGISM